MYYFELNQFHCRDELKSTSNHSMSYLREQTKNLSTQWRIGDVFGSRLQTLQWCWKCIYDTLSKQLYRSERKSKNLFWYLSLPNETHNSTRQSSCGKAYHPRRNLSTHNLSRDGGGVYPILPLIGGYPTLFLGVPHSVIARVLLFATGYLPEGSWDQSLG